MRPAVVTTLAGLAFYVTLASVLIALALALSVFAVGVWWRNRTNLQALDAMLRKQAYVAQTALKSHKPTGA